MTTRFVTGKIKAALLADENEKSLDIAVISRQGEAQLNGFVNSQSQIDRALEVARDLGRHVIGFDAQQAFADLTASKLHGQNHSRRR